MTLGRGGNGRGSGGQGQPGAPVAGVLCWLCEHEEDSLTAPLALAEPALLRAAASYFPLDRIGGTRRLHEPASLMGHTWGQ